MAKIVSNIQRPLTKRRGGEGGLTGRRLQRIYPVSYEGGTTSSSHGR
jgi:hypothetical protein